MTQPLLAIIAIVASLASPAPMKMSMPASTPPPKPNATEAAFVARVSSALLAAYPTDSAATAAGYMRMTRVEDDGTIIYATMKYTGIDEAHPNFLWYDRHGKLVGLDYEYPVKTWPKPPGSQMYPVSASRWTTIPQHAHFAYRVGSGPIKYKGAKLFPNMMGGKITADELRADKLLPKGATLVWAEAHPKCWDLGFWTVSNPSGAFADLDPLVK